MNLWSISGSGTIRRAHTNSPTEWGFVFRKIKTIFLSFAYYLFCLWAVGWVACRCPTKLFMFIVVE